MLSAKEITADSVLNPSETRMQRGGHSVFNLIQNAAASQGNIEAVKLIYEASKVPFTIENLRHTRSGEVARYLMTRFSLDPFHSDLKPRWGDGKMPYFSEQNSARLGRDSEGGLRHRDIREIGQKITMLSGALITEVSPTGTTHTPPNFTCASVEDSQLLLDFLNAEGVTDYHLCGGRQIEVINSFGDQARFIRTFIGR